MRWNASFALVAAGAALFAVSCERQPAQDPVGRLYHYLRTNQDGSEPEHVWVFRKSAAEVEVMKEVERCTNAAYVAAKLDLARNQPESIVGGRLNRDGTQTPFAYLTYDPATRQLAVKVPQIGVNSAVHVEREPWRIYDFDLADLGMLSAGHAPPREDFTFGVALAWPADEKNPLKYRGSANAKFSATETLADRDARRFDVTGALNGALWLDARDGHVIEARFAEPNHAAYRDFRIVLRSVEDKASARWDEVRLAHWRGCPAE